MKTRTNTTIWRVPVAHPVTGNTPAPEPWRWRVELPHGLHTLTGTAATRASAVAKSNAAAANELRRFKESTPARAIELAEAFDALLGDVEELLATGILTDECDLAKRLEQGDFESARKLASKLLPARCPQCGMLVSESDGDEFCRGCGRALPENV